MKNETKIIMSYLEIIRKIYYILFFVNCCGLWVEFNNSLHHELFHVLFQNVADGISESSSSICYIFIKSLNFLCVNLICRNSIHKIVRSLDCEIKTKELLINLWCLGEKRNLRLRRFSTQKANLFNVFYCK